MMNVFVFLMVLVFLSGMPTAWSAKAAEKPKAAPGSPDENAFLKELDSIRDPFVSPLAKTKKPEVKNPVPIPPPVEPVRPVVPIVRQPEPPRPAPVVPAPPTPVVPPFSSAGLKINGIVWNTNLPQAIVNDRVVRIGEDLQGAQIVAIKKEGIEVIHNGTKHILKITDEQNETDRNQSLDARRSQ
jgi:hypothetical protein